MARCTRRRHELLVRAANHENSGERGNEQAAPSFAVFPYRKPWIQDLTEAGLDLAGSPWALSLVPAMTEAPLNCLPKLTRFPFANLPQATHNEP
jgi:hypothetical protein